MHRLCLTAMLFLVPVMAPADTPRGVQGLSVEPLQENSLDRLRWQARPVVVLGPAADVQAQIAALQAEAGALSERDVVVLTEGPGASELRTDTGFQVLLIGKDGGVKLRRTAQVAPSEIIALIDTMPMRQREAGEDG